MTKTIHAAFLTAGLLVSAASLHSQQAPKALTNDDIVSMVKNALPDEVIVNAIQANECDFDISANGLIAMKKKGVSRQGPRRDASPADCNEIASCDTSSRSF